MRKKMIILIMIFILIVSALFAKKVFFPKQPLGEVLAVRGGIDKITVKADKVRREDLDFILSYVGGLKARDEAFVFSKVSGKLYSYLVNEGDMIEKGEVIALIDRDETGLKYELAKVESPISGVVGKTFLDKGANIIVSPIGGQGQSATLALVVNMDEILVKLDIPETDVPYLKKGLKAFLRVDAYPQEEFTGEVSRISEVVDTLTRTLPIEITILNPEHRLKSGMFARIKIFAGKHAAALVVMRDALVKENNSNYIYVVEGSRAKKVMVKPGIYQDNKVEVSEGLEENQRVIIFGHQGLKDGSEINVVE